MDIEKELEKIFNDDELNLLNVKPRISNTYTPHERLIKSFEEINDFIDKHKTIPQSNADDILERSLSFRLQGIMEDFEKIKALAGYDKHNLLTAKQNAIETLDDVFEDDDINLLSDHTDIFTLKNIPQKKAKTDFVARRKVCSHFEDYEEIFKKCQHELKLGIRMLEKFNEKQIKEGELFVLNGILVYVDKIYSLKKDKNSKQDGRTHLIFENGTESNMLFRSLGKGLFENGKHVINTTEEKLQRVNEIHKEDEPTGYIYVLQSKSKDVQIRSMKNFYKIGYSETTVAERIKNAHNEPTYLMAPVKIVAEFKTYNMNTPKFEALLHNFFGNCQVSIDVFDNSGVRHSPREWFQVPYEIIVHAINLMRIGEIDNYIYDREKTIIKVREKTNG